MQDQINSIIKFVEDIHKKHQGGCKSSCFEITIGYHHAPVYEQAFWFCEFGGYCFGNLSRKEEIRSFTLESLDKKVRKVILGAIEEEEFLNE